MKRDLSKVDTQAFDPSNPAFRWCLWKHYDTSEGWRWHFYWRRFAAASVLFLALAWFGLTAIAWAFVTDGRGFTNARYSDICLPWRWPDYLASLGQYYYTKGAAELDKGDGRSALSDLQASLALRPGDLKIRRLFAITQFRSGLWVACLQTLLKGVDQAVAAGDDLYLRTLFALMAQLQFDDQAAALGRRLLPPRPDPAPLHGLIAFQTATALYNRGHFTEAEHLLQTWNLLTRPEGEMLGAECEWGLGRHELAMQRLEDDLPRFSQREELYLALERMHRAAGQPEAALRYATLCELSDPNQPRPRIDSMRAEQAVGDRPDLEKEIGAFCSDFKSNPGALQQLAQFAVDSGRPDVVERVRALTQKAHAPTLTLDLAIIEASLVAKDYRRAEQVITRVETNSPPQNSLLLATLSGFKCITQFGLQYDTAEASFNFLLPAAAKLHQADGIFLAQRLSALNRHYEARLLVEAMMKVSADNPEVLTELIQVEAASHNRTGLIAYLPAFLRTRNPGAALLSSALAVLSVPQDRALANQVKQAIALSRSMP